MTELLDPARPTWRTDAEPEMHRAFIGQAEEILANPDAYLRAPDDPRHMGLELEASVIHNQTAANQQLRDEIVGRDGRLTYELGAGQIETTTPPVDILRSKGLESLAKQTEEVIALLRQRAHAVGCQVLLSGTNPLVLLHEIERTKGEKYTRVPDYNNRNRTSLPVLGPNQLPIGEAALVSLLNSIQPNFEAQSLDDAVDKLNRLLMISPMAVALTANARYLALQDSDMADLRVPAWQISHDTRSPREIKDGVDPRVGIPNTYYEDIGDYFKRIAEHHPFILDDPEHALQIGIGMNWKDAKIKLIDSPSGPTAVVEFRPMSTQPTAEENASALLFVTGRLMYSQASGEQLLPMNYLQANADAAAHNGRLANLWTQDERGVIKKLPGPDALALEIERAKRGIELADIPNRQFAVTCIDELRRNLQATPSDRLAKLVEAGKGNMNERLLGAYASIGALR